MKNIKVSIFYLYIQKHINIVFCKPNTFVLEFKSITAGNVIGNLARNLSINFYEISRKPLNEDNNQQGLISVPIDLIRKKLS